MSMNVDEFVGQLEAQTQVQAQREGKKPKAVAVVKLKRTGGLLLMVNGAFLAKVDRNNLNRQWEIRVSYRMHEQFLLPKTYDEGQVVMYILEFIAADANWL